VHIPTHILSGWVIGNCFPLSPAQRLGCMIAATIPDVDGFGWPIVYLWPFSDFKFVNWDAWDLSSWQNRVTGFALIAITVLIGWQARRTPIEVLYPRLDRMLTRSHSGNRRAAAK